MLSGRSAFLRFSLPDVCFAAIAGRAAFGCVITVTDEKPEKVQRDGIKGPKTTEKAEEGGKFDVKK
jgi:hypothetical protein